MLARAILCRALGPPEVLEIGDVALAEPDPGQALVRVRSAGVNFPDLLQVAGAYQHKPALPFVPGFEIAGDVADLKLDDGMRPPAHVTLGARVMASVRGGGYAEFALVPVAALRAVPSGFSYAEAAAFPVAAGTAFVALVERGGLRAGETVLVLGAAGGVGLAAVQLASALGARVIAVAGRADKREAAIAGGAAHALAPSEDLKAAVLALTDGRGADLVYDPVGGDAFDQAVRTLAWGGRLLVVGFASGRIPEISLNRALIKGISLIGVRAGEYVRRSPDSGPRIQAAVDALANDGQLRPRIHAEVPLEQAADALRMLAARDVIGKVVLVP